MDLLQKFLALNYNKSATFPCYLSRTNMISQIKSVEIVGSAEKKNKVFIKKALIKEINLQELTDKEIELTN